MCVENPQARVLFGEQDGQLCVAASPKEEGSHCFLCLPDGQHLTASHPLVLDLMGGVLERTLLDDITFGEISMCISKMMEDVGGA